MRNASAISVFAMKHPCPRALICAIAFSIVWYWTVHKSCGMLSLMLDLSGWERWCISRYEPWYVHLGLAFFLRGAARVLTMCQEHGKQENLEVGLTPAGFVLGHIAAERRHHKPSLPSFLLYRGPPLCGVPASSVAPWLVVTDLSWVHWPLRSGLQAPVVPGLPCWVVLL